MIEIKKRKDKEKLEKAAFYYFVYIHPIISDVEIMKECRRI